MPQQAQRNGRTNQASPAVARTAIAPIAQLTCAGLCQSLRPQERQWSISRRDEVRTVEWNSACDIASASLYEYGPNVAGL